MTKEEALYNFWSSFTWKAYEENSVPTGERAPAFPYITYQVVTDALGANVPMNASLWDKKTANHSAMQAINNKAKEVSEYIGRGGVAVSFTGGIIWIRRGNPFAQGMGDDSSDAVRRKLLTIQAEFISAD